MCALYLRDTVPQICGIRRRSAYQLLAIMRPNGILPRILTQTKVSNNLNVSSDSVIYTDRRSYNFSEYMQDVLGDTQKGCLCIKIAPRCDAHRQLAMLRDQVRRTQLSMQQTA